MSKLWSYAVRRGKMCCHLSQMYRSIKLSGFSRDPEFCDLSAATCSASLCCEEEAGRPPQRGRTQQQSVGQTAVQQDSGQFSLHTVAAGLQLKPPKSQPSHQPLAAYCLLIQDTIYIFALHNSHTCRPAASQIVNKIGSKLYKRTIPAVNAKITRSILVHWEFNGGTRTNKNWEILAHCDQCRWENMVYHENAVKMEFCCSDLSTILLARSSVLE